MSPYDSGGIDPRDVSGIDAENALRERDLSKKKDAALKIAQEALEHIAEYWNRSENDRAMNDALYHMIETAEKALAAIKEALG